MDNSFTEVFDEFVTYGSVDKDPFESFNEDLYERVEEVENVELSENEEKHRVSKEVGSDFCKFVTASYVHFIRFLNYLSKHGYDKMIVRDQNRYIVEVYRLTNAESDLLMKAFLGMRNLRPVNRIANVA